MYNKLQCVCVCLRLQTIISYIEFSYCSELIINYDVIMRRCDFLPQIFRRSAPGAVPLGWCFAPPMWPPKPFNCSYSTLYSISISMTVEVYSIHYNYVKKLLDSYKRHNTVISHVNIHIRMTSHEITYDITIMVGISLPTSICNWL